jgi:ketosteroid isomerase-like protein
LRLLLTARTEVEGTMNESFAITASTTLPALVLALAGCTSTHDTPLPKDVTTALETAFNKGDIAACAELYTDDAEIISKQSSPVRGKEAIGKFFKDQFAREILFDTDTTVSVVSGDVAMEQGTYRVRNVVRGVDVEFGDYLNVWRKLPDGKWKAYRSMYNVTKAPIALVSIVTESEDRTTM